MKKILLTILLTVSLNATAFGGWNNGPWNSGYNNNGFIDQNPFSMFSPDWFREEMDDFADEFNNNNSWGNRGWGNRGWNNNRGWGNRGWNNNNFNNMPWNNNTPWGNRY